MIIVIILLARLTALPMLLSALGTRCMSTCPQVVFIAQVVFIGKRLPYVLAAVSADGYLRLWNVKLTHLLAEVQVSQDSSLTAVCVDPFQTHLVVSDSAGFIYTYTIAGWKGSRNNKQVSRLLDVCSKELLQP